MSKDIITNYEAVLTRYGEIIKNYTEIISSIVDNYNYTLLTQITFDSPTYASTSVEDDNFLTEGWGCMNLMIFI